MFRVLETKSVVKELDKAPREILEVYEFWKSVVQISGPTGLKGYSGFKDHALRGEWAGARSSYLNRKSGESSTLLKMKKFASPWCASRRMITEESDYG